MRRTLSVVAGSALLAAAVPATADAAARLVIKGRGFGHGIGMSQYGAYGYATHGFGYQDILSRYYTSTQLTTADHEDDVRVLLQSGSRVSVSGAVTAGERRLSPTRTYTAYAAGDQVALRSATGRSLGTYPAPLRLAAPDGGAVRVRGSATNGVSNGQYRGALEVRPSGGRVLAINALGLEDYVRGVVGAEVPASWPAEALKAQAVAARTYAITTGVKATQGFNQYADTRSQMYKGVAAESPATDAAVAATAAQIVTQNGQPVTTFYFSTSGGHTENIEFSFIGALPQPWLKGVVDPFDDASPKHVWKPITLTPRAAVARLGGLVKGGFRGIKVTERGTSPRIVEAQVVGTGGATPITGPELRKRFGLDDTWATFTYISSNSATAPTVTDDAPAPDPEAADPPAPAAAAAPAPAAATTPSGGAQAARAGRALTGVVDRAQAGQRIRVQQRAAGRWHTVGATAAQDGGSYRAGVSGAGTYRIVWGGIAGPAVPIR